MLLNVNVFDSSNVNYTFCFCESKLFFFASNAVCNDFAASSVHSPFAIKMDANNPQTETAQQTVTFNKPIRAFKVDFMRSDTTKKLISRKVL